MSEFTKPLILKKLKGRMWEVAVGFHYYVGEEGSKDYVYVPTGFRTDLASIPRIFWVVLPSDGTYSQSAVLHDRLYYTQERSRKNSDDIFLESMEVLGVSWWRRKVIHRAVRMFGWACWSKKSAKAS